MRLMGGDYSLPGLKNSVATKGKIEDLEPCV